MNAALTPIETYGFLIIIKWIIDIVTGVDLSDPFPYPFPG